MGNYNRVELMGNLTRDPEMRNTAGGLAICSFGLAINERFKDKDGAWKERPLFVDVTIFGKRGEAFGRFHKKGQAAFIYGRLRMDQWDDKQTGKKRTKLGVVGDGFEFIGGEKTVEHSDAPESEGELFPEGATPWD